MAESRFRKSTNELCMDLTQFKNMPFEQVCKILNIKVSG